MTSYSTLSKAPVVEAVIELRVSTRESVDVGRLMAWSESLKEQFPKSRNLHFMQARVGVSATDELINSVDARHEGVRLDSEDEKWVVQGKLNSLAVSRIAPYGNFEDLLSKTQSLWRSYADAVGALAVVRQGVRYINRIDLKGDTVDFDTILTAGPKIPPEMPQALTAFTNRVVVPIPEKRATVVIMQVFELPSVLPESDSTSMVLDIDAYSEDPYDVTAPEIWSGLMTLRDVKNMAFFSSLAPDFLETLK